MQFLIGLGAWLGEFVASKVGFWVLSALVFFGLQWGTTEFVVEPLLARIQEAFSGAPSDIIQWLAFLNVDRYVTIVLSAYATAASVGGLKLMRKPQQ